MTHPVTSPSQEATARIENLLDDLADTRRKLAALHARESELLTAALHLATEQAADHGGSSDIPVRSLSAQIGAALRVSDRTVQRRLGEAAVLHDDFPATHRALATGEIDRAHAQVIVEAGAAIDDGTVRAAYERAAIDIARRETPGRLRPAARLLAQRLHPVPLAERHREAAGRRGVWVHDGDDGMAELVAALPAVIAHGIHDRLTQLARASLTAAADTADPADTGDPAETQGATHGDSPNATRDLRGIGELRADVLADLLLTGHADAAVSAASLPVSRAITAQVQITIPAATLTGDDTEPAEITGRGTIDPVTARDLAGRTAGWDRVLTDPVSGTVIGVDRYRPSEHLRRTLRVRDEHCRFPGCRMPTRRCDIDHTIAREHDGPTRLDNLAHLCRRHHVLKHHSAWRVRQRDDGVLEWTSPTGRVYPDVPARTVTFTAAPDPQPAPF